MLWGNGGEGDIKKKRRKDTTQRPYGGEKTTLSAGYRNTKGVGGQLPPNLKRDLATTGPETGGGIWRGGKAC